MDAVVAHPAGRTAKKRPLARRKAPAPKKGKAEVTELIQGFAIARRLETTEAELIETIFPHPTLSETMHESVLDAYGRVIHF